MIPIIISRFYKKMAQVIPAVTRISPAVIRVLGCNPGPMTLQGTNTYIVGTGKRRILIDTGDEDVPQYINHLRNVLQQEDIDLAHIFITHHHHDHLGGLADILDDLMQFTKHCEIWKFPRVNEEKISEISTLKDGQEFHVEGATVRIIHTPGHTTDHISLHLNEENAIFSGDCILGEGTAVFEDLYDYIESLKILQETNPTVIYPGHGNIIYDAVDRIRFYISHRLERENQILKVLHSNNVPFTEGELVKLIYKGLNANLFEAAKSNVNHHLKKLLRDERVRWTNGKWQI